MADLWKKLRQDTISTQGKHSKHYTRAVCRISSMTRRRKVSQAVDAHIEDASSYVTSR